MAALFPPWSDTAIRVVLCLFAAAVAAAVALPMIYVRTPYNQQREFPLDQPVQFDHRHHVRDDGIDCRYCHSGAERGPYAGIPATEVCMGCHAQIWNRSPMLEPVRRSYFSGQPLRWNRVHDLPDFVYFDHSVHLAGGVGCVTCHGRVDRMAVDYQVAPLTMGWCLECHRDPEPHRRPLGAVASMTWSRADAHEPWQDGAPPPGVVLGTRDGFRTSREGAAAAEPPSPHAIAHLRGGRAIDSLTTCTTCHR